MEGSVQAAVTEAEWDAERVRSRRIALISSGLGFLLVPSLGWFALLLADATSSGVAYYPVTVAWMAVLYAPSTWLIVHASMKQQRKSDDIVGALTRQNAYQATHDALTGLPNRLYFSRALDRELANAKQVGGWVAVALFDLDRFKEVNDTFGHDIGDELLDQIGPRMSQLLVEGELLARLGGDEFVMLISGTHPGPQARIEQQKKVTQAREALAAPFTLGDVALTVEASVGLASYPDDGDTGQMLLQRADIAMYQAKNNHQEIAVYDRALDGHTPRKLRLLGDLRQAIDRGELVVYYQPLVNIATMHASGAEALVRWNHPIEGLLMPADFLPLAESSGLIHELTRHVLTCAVRDAKAWQAGGHPLVVSVNISARCLIDTKLPDAVAAALAAAGLPARLLKLEITESAIIADPIRAQHIINQLHRLGVALSIDDFGTGYTSLAYLRDLPIHELKIDRSFVTRILHEDKDAIIVRTAIDLAQRLGLESVAEGVDDPAILVALAAMGCTTAQGYALSVPLPVHHITPWVQRWNHDHSPAPQRHIHRPRSADPASENALLG